MDDQPQSQQPISKKQQRRLERKQAKQARAAAQTGKRTGSRIIFWIVILAVIGFFVYAIGRLATNTPTDSNTKTDIAITASDYIKGTPGASVELIEYSDFQCPACATFYPIIKQLVSEYSDRIAFAYRHFPLPQHQHGKIMARAAEAAGKQGKFWEMHDLIFENQSQWSALIKVDQTISSYATKLGLDIAQFEKDIDSGEIKEIVDSSYQSGSGYGVNSTPSFFLNGVKILSPRGLTEFEAVIDNALISANDSTAN
ncbi:MAG: thioredoxin domain-containing protein [bacterium]|nr:thioredoxin domain-containing protein [bacterium]